MSVLEALALGIALAIITGIACEMAGRKISQWIDGKESEDDVGEMDY